MAEYDFSDIDFSGVVDQTFDPTEVTTAEKLAFGASDETMLGGNIVRMGTALFDSAFDSDLTLDEALSRVESKRQRDVFRSNPKFFGIDEEQEDGAILTGRVGTALVDPLPWLMPWTRVEKVGKLASAGFGAAFGATDAALRDKIVYGEVDPINVGISAALTGGISGLSAGIRQRVGQEAAEVPEEAASRVPMEADDIAQIIPDSPDQVNEAAMPSMREVIRAYQRQQWFGQPEPIQVSSTSPMRDLIRAHNRRLAGYSQPLVDTEVEALQRATAKVVKQETIEQSRTKNPPLSYVTQPIVEAKRVVAALSSKVEKAKKADKPELERQLAQAQNNLQLAQKKYFDTQLDVMLTKTDSSGAILEELNSSGELTNSLMSKILYEGTRPIVGALGGFAASGIIGDEDDDGLTIGLMIAGAITGRYHSNLRKSNLTAVQKADGAMMIDEGAGRNIRTLVKMHSAGTIATKLDAMGGYAKIMGNMLLQRPGSGTDSVEARVSRETRKFIGQVVDTLGEASEDLNIRKLTGQIINGFDLNKIKVGYRGIDGSLDPLTESQIVEARRLAPLLAKQRDELADSVKAVGIKFSDLGDNYGMAQLYNMDAIRGNEEAFRQALIKAIRIQDPKIKEEQLYKDVDKIFEAMTGVKKYEGKVQITRDNLFSEGKFRPLEDHFEKHRRIKDPAARKFLAEQGYINLDAQEVFATYADRTIKGREFARTFGAQGELIDFMLGKVDEAFTAAGTDKKGFGEDYKKYLYDTIDTFWGSYGADKAGIVGQTVLPLLTTLANSTYLTRVTISSLGDLIQPFQNSGFGAASKALLQKAGKTPSFSKQANFKYDLGWEREYTALMTQGGDPLNNFHHNLGQFNKGFFNLVGLAPLTRAARGFAYDTGVNRAYAISKKSKLSSGVKKEMETLGLSTSDLKTLKKYKTVQAAFNSDDGKVILDRVGQKQTDRDAIVPMVGNRLLFTQNNNPYIRSLGQFLSWAQAKTSQTNSLIERVENGDAALALRALLLTGVYGGVQGLREFTSPSYNPDEPKYSDTYEGYTQFAKRSMELSGNYLPWQIDKLFRTIESGKRGQFVSGLTPSASYAESFVNTLFQVQRNVEAEDYEGAVSDVARVVPFGREIIGYGERLGFDMPEDRPNRAKGGIIENVPNAPEEPDQRIDKMTGLPYDQQAGTAFVDEEDPLRRLGFVGGGEVDPLRRLGFGLGSLVARQGSKATRGFMDDTPQRSTEELTKEFDDLTSAINKGETPEMFKETVSSPKPTKVSSTDVDDTIAPYEDIPAPATYDEMFKALASDKKKKINVEIPEGRQVGIRLDIPAYLRKKDSAWVPTIHDETKGGVTSHRGTVSITNVDLTMSPSKQKASLDIREGDKMKAEIDRLAEQGTLRTGFRTGDMSKGKLIDATTPEGKKQIAALKKQYDKKPFARIGGNLVNRTDEENFSLAKKYLKDPEWTQVGFNPMKHSYFFDRRTGDPVIGGEEAIQVGPLVLVKNAIKGDRKDFLFSEGGKVLRALNREKYATGSEIVKNLLTASSYEVRKGDTLSKIAQDAGLSTAALLKLNPEITNPSKIQIGQNIKLTSDSDSMFSFFDKPPKQILAKVTGAETIAKAVEPLIPTNVKQLVRDVFGYEDSITEDNLKSEELEALKKAVGVARERGSNVIEYEDYGTQAQGESQYADVGGGSMLGKLGDPSYSMKTFIGQGGITQNEQGETIVLDRYNFNDAVDGNLFGFIQGVAQAGVSPYLQARNVGRHFGSGPGEGSPIAINLGKI